MHTFEVKSGKIIISDPCYTPNETTLDGYALGLNVPAINGIWVVETEVGDYGKWGQRVKALNAFLQNEHDYPLADTIHQEVGVDSGQMAIVDANTWANGDPDNKEGKGDIWYNTVCDSCRIGTTGIFVGGCVSSTGFGDGLYHAVALVDKEGRAMRVRIQFIEEAENDD
jgi:hypothetical protein